MTTPNTKDGSMESFFTAKSRTPELEEREEVLAKGDARRALIVADTVKSAEDALTKSITFWSFNISLRES